MNILGLPPSPYTDFVIQSPEAGCSMLVPVDVHCFEAGEQDMQQRKWETATTGPQSS